MMVPVTILKLKVGIPPVLLGHLIDPVAQVYHDGVVAHQVLLPALERDVEIVSLAVGGLFLRFVKHDAPVHHLAFLDALAPIRKEIGIVLVDFGIEAIFEPTVVLDLRLLPLVGDAYHGGGDYHALHESPLRLINQRIHQLLCGELQFLVVDIAAQLFIFPGIHEWLSEVRNHLLGLQIL